MSQAANHPTRSAVMVLSSWLVRHRLPVAAAIRRAVSTTGCAVTLTAITILLSVVPWSFSNLRFQGEMAQLLAILLFFNMLGAIIVVPALYSIFRPRAARVLGGAPKRKTPQSESGQRILEFFQMTPAGGVVATQAIADFPNTRGGVVSKASGQAKNREEHSSDLPPR